MHETDWNQVQAAQWRSRKQQFRAIRHLDPVLPDQLLGVDRQKSALIENTRRLVTGLPANNALLWGARGTGKSSIIKAVFNAFKPQGLRIIEVDKFDLIDLPDIVDEIRDYPFPYLIFCDDLAFEQGDAAYQGLKSVLEGSLELPPDNVKIYATSNRRHLVPEYMSDNLAANVSETELRQADSTEEKISLADRFGLTLSFYPINQPTYLEIIDHYFPNWPNDRAELHRLAIRFAHEKGLRSGRTAKQFYNSIAEA